MTTHPHKTKINQINNICELGTLNRQHGRGVLSGGDSGEGTVAAAVVVVIVLSAGVSAGQHYRPCWPDLQCETGFSIYQYLFV